MARAAHDARRRVGRPSRAPERREQILEAVERCIVERGIAGTTLARVADAADMPRSLIHHYLGTRDALLRATAERAVANVTRSVRAGLAEAAEGDAIGRRLDVLFGPRMRDRRITRLIDELGVASGTDPHVRRLLAGMYEAWVSSLARELERAFPDAAADERRTVAHAVVALADAASRFGDYDFDPENLRRTRAVAERLVRALGKGGETCR